MVAPKPAGGDIPAPDQLLIDAARHYARRVTGQAVQRITLTLGDGSKRKLDVPAPAGFATDWPNPEGWAVRGDRGAFDGVVFRLAGKVLAAYGALVEAGDGGLTMADLKEKVWDKFTDERTVQNAISRLRAALREGLGLPEELDPIDADGERYRLRAVG